MHDLFGNPIELPVKRGKASACLGAQTPEAQSSFAWVAGEPAAQPKRVFPAGGEAPLAHAALAQDTEPLDDEAELEQALADLSMHGVVGQYLKDRNLPFVDVFEVKENHFANSRLETFDFVVSAPEGHNWLLYAAPLSTAAQEDLREWERIFGPGFHALVAEEVENDDDTITLAFHTLDGERVTLQ